MAARAPSAALPELAAPPELAAQFPTAAARMMPFRLDGTAWRPFRRDDISLADAGRMSAHDADVCRLRRGSGAAGLARRLRKQGRGAPPAERARDAPFISV
jgi:hypothetical protein